jgi:cyanophycinase-like exopeptidase
MGRLTVFLARLMQDGRSKSPKGLGIDEATAVLLDPDGKGRVVGKASAFFVRAKQKPARCEAKQPLTFEGLEVIRMDRGSGVFDFKSWRGPGGAAAASTLNVVSGEVKIRP